MTYTQGLVKSSVFSNLVDTLDAYCSHHLHLRASSLGLPLFSYFSTLYNFQAPFFDLAYHLFHLSRLQSDKHSEDSSIFLYPGPNGTSFHFLSDQ